ncbi:hypothetical protein BDM02DRAFT_2982101 [Thelephora ganbajun]|uniref:Uncharacterized protein n=1 Tax=Thelephora ganbajun TaxID=370292 RepID=A0ACB6ZAP2_THEGA|nr:hypothetical protein BDM02DRAFT_2982101 [Thelephora ganbajun]
MSESPSEIQIHVKGANELKLQITIKTDKTVQDLKHAIAEKTDAPADRQRLIYSGKVLKDEEPLSNYKIQSGHTIHMVKSAAKSGGNSSTPGAAPSQSLPQMQTGQNPHDPLTQLNSHLGFGAMAGLNPFADMGVNPNDPNMLQNMLNSPQFLQQMSSVFSNPQIMDQLMAMNPQFGGLDPQMRQVFQSERFRQMMSNPETLRTMLQMSNLMHEMGAGSTAGGFPGMGGGLGNFGGVANPTAAPNPTTNTNTTRQTQSTTSATNTTGTTTSLPPPNPFFDPAMMQQLMGAFGGPGGGLGGGLFGAPATPADTRPPEERFQTQLQQLNDMGFFNASQNIRALQATGGNLNAAIEYILNGGGL